MAEGIDSGTKRLVLAASYSGIVLAVMRIVSLNAAMSPGRDITLVQDPRKDAPEDAACETEAEEKLSTG